MNTTRFLSIIGLLILATLACGLRIEVQPTPLSSEGLEAALPAAGAETVPASASIIVEATPLPSATTPLNAPLPTREAIPTAALPPSPTNTPAIPSVTLTEKLNARSGPGLSYDKVGQLKTGARAIIVGRNSDGAWWQIIYPDAANGLAWISAEYGLAVNTQSVSFATAPPIPTPFSPTLTPTSAPSPTSPPSFDYVVKSVRLRSNEENGGVSPNGSASACGNGNNLYVLVEDQQGNPLDMVIINDEYDHKRITGSQGPGRTDYIFGKQGGFKLFIEEDQNAGRSVTSEISPLLSPLDEQIPIPWLIEAHYCATEEECAERASKNGLCRFHYSYNVVFQRTW